MNSKNLLMTAVGIGISLGLLYVTVYVASKAWEKGQEK
jgi:hypothetical protein